MCELKIISSIQAMTGCQFKSNIDMSTKHYKSYVGIKHKELTQQKGWSKLTMLCRGTCTGHACMRA